MLGTIKNVKGDKGFAFVVVDGKDIFLHATALAEGDEGYDLISSLTPGQEITINEIGTGPDGRPKIVSASIN